MVGQWGPASAPASIGNVGVGFDILGQAFDAARDIVTAVRDEKPGARLMQVSGLVNSLPDTPAKNTALAAAQAVLSAAGAPPRLQLSLVEGISSRRWTGGLPRPAGGRRVPSRDLLVRPSS